MIRMFTAFSEMPSLFCSVERLPLPVGRVNSAARLRQYLLRKCVGQSLRPLGVAALGVALAVIPAMAATTDSRQQQASQTSLRVDTRDVNGHTDATLSVAVTGADGLPAAGSIAVSDHGKPLAGFALDKQGQASATLSLAPGDHNLTAVYNGDTAHLASRSQVTPVRAVTGSTPGFSVAVSPATLSIPQGQSKSVIVSITPVNAASLKSPMFVTISCSGIPDQTTCSFTPENIQIPVGATAPITSSLVIATQLGSQSKAEPLPHRDARPIALALLLPGSFALAGLAFGIRRRRGLSRFVLLALLAFVTVLGASACNPLYNYKNHGPLKNLPTPTGNYTVEITAQSSDGVTADTQSTTLALTVTQ